MAGSYTLQVTIKDSSGISTTSSVTVTVNQSLTSIKISPLSAAVRPGNTQQFVAAALDQYGYALSVQPSIAFSLGSGSAGSITSAGLYTAPGSSGGSATVIATYGTLTDTANVTVNNNAPAVATAAAASPGTVTGTMTNLSVLGTDGGGQAALTYTWSATGPAPVTFTANGTNAAQRTIAVFSAAGTYVFTAAITNAAGLTAASFVTVTVVSTPVITVSPGAITVNPSATQQFSASSVDQFGAPVSTTCTWSVVSGSGTIGSTGLFTAPAASGGLETVQAAIGSAGRHGDRERPAGQ